MTPWGAMWVVGCVPHVFVGVCVQHGVQFVAHRECRSQRVVCDCTCQLPQWVLLWQHSKGC